MKHSGAYDAIVIGGGFYGLRIALYLREVVGLSDVLVLEAESSAMTHASYVNQARVHKGYHYPRSILTGYRSAQSFDRFVEEYYPAVIDDFIKYYAIASKLSKINARQFEAFCKKIGAPYVHEKAILDAYFNPRLTEAVYSVQEYAFDSRKVRELLLKRLSDIRGVTIVYGQKVSHIKQTSGGVRVSAQGNEYDARRVFNCTYAQINALHRSSNLELLPLKHEVTEMCLIELPESMKDFSVTIMDGPFFSIMPFPSRGLHTLSHVRYTPHVSWLDNEGTFPDHYDTYAYKETLQLRTNYKKMYADVVRYIPGLAKIKFRESISEVKTVLVKSETDDSRPILFRSDFGIQGYTCIMGGKLDNIYDAFEEIDSLYGKKS